MNASIDKTIAPLLTAAGAALLALATGGVVDFAGLYAAVLVTVTGLATAGVVYFIKYHAVRPNKALAAAALPLAVALVHYLSTGELNEPEILLGVQGIIGFIGTYIAERVEIPNAQPSPVDSMRRGR